VLDYCISNSLCDRYCQSWEQRRLHFPVNRSAESFPSMPSPRGQTDTSPVVGFTRLNMVAVSCENHSSYSNLERRRELCTAKAKCYL
jgi:hypothetical protein